MSYSICSFIFFFLVFRLGLNWGNLALDSLKHTLLSLGQADSLQIYFLATFGALVPGWVTVRPPENIFCPSPESFYLKLSVKVRKFKFSSTRNKKTKCNILPQTISVSSRQFVSVTDNHCLSQKVYVCYRQSVSITDNLCLSQTYRHTASVIRLIYRPFQLKYT